LLSGRWKAGDTQFLGQTLAVCLDDNSAIFEAVDAAMEEIETALDMVRAELEKFQ